MTQAPISPVAGVPAPGGPVQALPRRNTRARLARVAAAVPQDVSKLAMWAVGLAIFFSISRMHQYIKPLGLLKGPFFFTILATVILLTQTRIWKPSHITDHWIWKAIAILVLFACVGIPFSIYPRRSFEFIRDGFSRAIWTAILTFAVARTRGGSRFIARTLAISGIAAALLALKMGRHDSDGRLSGGYSYDANDIALIACVTLPFVYWYCMDKTNKYRWLMGLMAVPLLMVIIRSGSRGGFLGLAAVVLGIMVLGIHNVSPRLRRMSLLLVVLAIFAIPLMPAEYRERIASITETQNDYNMTSASGRMEVWKRGWGYAKDHPIFGVGIDNFRTAEGTLSDLVDIRRARGRGLKWSAAHNSYIQVLTEMGFIAGITFPVLILGTVGQLIFKVGKRTRLEGRNADLIGPLLGVALFGYSVSGFFLSFAYYDIVYVMLALASAILLRANGPIVPERATAPVPVPVPARGPRRGSLPVRQQRR